MTDHLVQDNQDLRRQLAEAQLQILAGTFQDHSAELLAECAGRADVGETIAHFFPRIFVLDLQGQYISMNSVGASELGLPSNSTAVQGKTPHEFFSEEYADEVSRIARQVITSTQPVLNHIGWQSYFDGSGAKSIQLSCLPRIDANGAVMELVLVVRDSGPAGENLLADKYRLLQNDHFINRLLDLDKCLIFVKDSEHRFRFINDAVALIYGTTTSEAIGKTDEDFSATPDQLSRFRRHDDQILNGQQSELTVEEAVRCADGKTRCFRTTKVPYEFDGTRHVLGVATDITDLVKERRHRNRKHRELRAIMDLAPVAIYFKDRNGRYTEVNPAFLDKACKTEFQDVLGKTAREIFEPSIADQIVACDSEIMKGSGRINDEINIPDQVTGRHRIYETSKVPRFNDKGEVIGIVGISIDVSKQRLEKAREVQLSRLEAIDTLIVSLKHDFLYVLLDELEQELRSISTIEDLSSRRQEWIDMLTFLQTYVEQLQWWLPDEQTAGVNMRINRTVFSLKSIVDQAIGWVGKYLREPPCENHVPDNIVFNGDRMLVLLLIFNLLHNAKRFTPDDKERESVHVLVEQVGQQCTISVDDAGCGLPPADVLQNLGKMKGNSYNPPGRSIKGSGFGLYLCRRIVEAHGGQMLSPRPSDRRGSVFAFSFPTGVK